METNNRIVKLTAPIIAAFAMLLSAAFLIPEHTVAAAPFKYTHDPAVNSEAMKDIVEDETAVYGFRPSETGSLSAYAAADWSDPETVEKGRRDRIAYHNSIESMYDLLRELQKDGKSTEEIARAVSGRRNELRLESYKDDPAGLQTLKQRNLEKYGHEEGPLPDELFAQYGTWEKVMEKAFSANVGMDACLGLYDDYYDLYVALGQVGGGAGRSPVSPAVHTDPAENAAAPVSPHTSDNGAALLFVLILSGAAVFFAAAVAGKKQNG